ncbi:MULTISPECIES: hypothetical protein [unclassified Corynebacterium]|uniref:hypothetical protein n=1 Tax=unclassified Corynebacterium TaxID=2624378 RepID=UPI0029CA507F|nr:MULTISPECIES: hypothetical protein [unclassified Corynebacterium]WPF65302.1 hypothetical protein OLX12_06855 [Corynebacterium sp. 22KM0430]WPF67797.1 hypothetical protein OLW90_06845 [Corynebacterium sp. 21KM1197]
MSRIRYGSVAVCLVGIATGMVAPVTTAASATAAEVAPGAPMRTKVENFDEVPVEIPLEIASPASCSQGVSGTVTLPDGSQKNVMVSAAHCLYGETGDEVDLAPEVYIPLEEGRKVIGTRDHGEEFDYDGTQREFFDPDNWDPIKNDPQDWATAELVEGVEMTRVADSVDQYGRRHGDPVVLTGVRDYRTLVEGEVSFDNFGQLICKDGQTTGRTCGVQYLRTRNGLWYVGLALPGDSGGVNFDPVTGEALGVSSTAGLGLFVRAQPIDAALEEAYDIPDGQVNEHFALPESTQPHTPMRTLDEEVTYQEQWWEENFPGEIEEPAPQTLEEAGDVAQANWSAGVGEVTLQTADAVNLLSEDPIQVDTVVNNAVETAEYVGGLVEETAQAYGEALDNLLAEEVTE